MADADYAYDVTNDEVESGLSGDEIDPSSKLPQLMRRASPSHLPTMTPRKNSGSHNLEKMTPRVAAHHCLLVVHGNSGYGKVSFLYFPFSHSNFRIHRLL
jgi:hypothetical protein